MALEQVIGLSVALLIMLIGTIGTLLPVIPGTPIILLAAVIHRLIFGQASVTIPVLLLLLGLTLLSFLVDYAAQVIGAKKLGATWKGVLGALIGGLVGLFFSIPGVLLGPFIGATLFELIGGRPFKPAARAGAGATLGLVLGAVGKISICVAMILTFAVTVIWRS